MSNGNKACTAAALSTATEADKVVCDEAKGMSDVCGANLAAANFLFEGAAFVAAGPVGEQLVIDAVTVADQGKLYFCAQWGYIQKATVPAAGREGDSVVSSR